MTVAASSSSIRSWRTILPGLRNEAPPGPDVLFRRGDDLDQRVCDTLPVIGVVQSFFVGNRDDGQGVGCVFTINCGLKRSVVVAIAIVGEKPDLALLNKSPNLLIGIVIGKAVITQAFELNGQDRVQFSKVGQATFRICCDRSRQTPLKRSARKLAI
jgi:hypothetical protein